MKNKISEADKLFNKLREGILGYTDMTKHLKKITDGYDIELLENLLIDIDVYIGSEKDAMSSSFTKEEIEKAVRDFKERNNELPYIVLDLFLSENEIPKKVLDLERLLFPFEFYDLGLFRSKIIEKILDLSRSKNTPSDVMPNIKFDFSATELVELSKALIENNNIKGKQSDVAQYFSKIFKIPINDYDRTLAKVKERNTDSETLFLDKLKTSLSNHFQDLREKKNSK